MTGDLARAVWVLVLFTFGVTITSIVALAAALVWRKADQRESITE